MLFYMIEAKPENLIGDRVYDSDPLDEELRKDGIEMIAPHRSNRSKPPTQDRRRLIPNPIDQNPWAHWRSPMDMMRQG